MAKDILFRKQAMESMLKGLDIAADAVGGTLGAKGLNVYFEDAITPEITNDGATIANKIYLKDKQEDAGAYIIRNVTSQTNDDAGDGTTTTAVLTQAIIHECLARPENPNSIKESLQKAGQELLKSLAKKSVKLKKEDIEKVALISAEDTNIAHLITEIIGKLGEKTVINVEDSKTFTTDYEIVDGFEAHVGFMSPHFVTDKKSNKAIYSDIPVLVTEKKIANIQDIKPIFEMFEKEGINSCVIIAEEIDDSMLGVLVQNKLIGTFNSLVIHATGWLLADIEGAVGARAISSSNGITFQNFKKEYLGFARKVVCDANKTLFATDGVASKKYASYLDMQGENEPNMFQARKFKERAARMRGGLAVLRIAAPTDAERSYLRRKAEDAVKATSAALEEGVVEGGGLTLWKLAQDLKPKTIGQEILKKALTAPFRKIIENAGKDYTEIVRAMPQNKGYDVKADTFVDMFAKGILDPSKVTRCALENSISIASTFCTTFCSIVEAVEEK